MRSRSNGGIIGAYQLPSQNYANGVFFIHDAAIYNTGNNPIWPLGTGFIYSASGGTISTAVDNANYKLHSFTANGTFTVSNGSGYLDILLVGGGGAGGCAYGTYGRGGGGAGGQVTLVQSVFVNGPTSFTVEVGQGGLGSANTITAVSTLAGKPSKVTSNTGYSMISYGGGTGEFYSSVTRTTPGDSTQGGGGAATSGTPTANGVLLPVNTRTNYGTSTTGTVTNYIYSSGGASLRQITTGGINDPVAGGGAGAVENGYDGYYPTTVSKSGQGGDGWLWSRTNYYYGPGGGGGGTYSWPVPNRSNTLGGLGGASPGSRASGNGRSAYDQLGGLGGAGAPSGIYGGGGGGAAAWNYSEFANGGNGYQGIVIFCYRYQ